ncbi:fasciclin domain-containing protein [Nocardioides massiliensis]|uniref:Surface protein with fasciclin (FAS1) repeats n=1 Tax=Nocardioides massiliensis TaxID=1325935 RepID=A0ABT9NLF8_9ACTN|nr:fasciclin domain-containing protein [Nocardioides massiliensis]MDP9821262.1 putative surface protein with fasciclin (FAS1) repeats [Nocardioides massiliensis]
MRTLRKSTLAVAAIAALSLTAACGSDDTADDSTASPETSEMSESPEESDDSMASDSMDPAAGLVGPGCAGYAEQVPDGAGSVEGMSQDPVAVAASNNPLLTTLTAAVSGQLNPEVDLVDTLNGDEFTVFAPVDDAFAKLPQETVETLGTPEGAETLSTVLTYHVVPGRIAPEDLAGTTQTTVQGADVEVTGEADSLMINDASVICGGVSTANATVYLIDTVLMPPTQ